MIARVQYVRDLRHEDADKLPRLAFWLPGSELKDTLSVAGLYVGKPATLTMAWKDGARATMAVFVKTVIFRGDSECLIEIDVEAAKPFHAEVGEEVKITFGGGRHDEASDEAE